MVVGITGGIGSGKSTVVNFFSEFKSIAIYLADDEAKKLMNTSEEIREKLIAEFSSEVYQNNELNRLFLANIVFKNKEKLAVLNSIVHPVVHRHLSDFIQKHQEKDYILYENAILFENGSDAICDKIITVTAPEEIRIDRVVKRDQTSREAVKNRINNQWSDAKKILQSHYIVENLELSKTKAQVLEIHKKLTKR